MFHVELKNFGEYHTLCVSNFW